MMNTNREQTQYLYMRNKVASLLISIFYSLELLRALWWGSATFFYTLFGAFILFIAFLLTLHRNPNRFYNSEICILSLIILSILISSYVNRNIEFNEAIWYLKYIFMLYVLLNSRLWGKPFAVFFYLFSGYLFLQIFRGISPVMLTVNVSQNAIGLYLLPLIVLYCVATHEKRRNIHNLLMAIIYTVIAIWTGSRSAVVVGFILLLYGILIEKDDLSIKMFGRIIILLALLLVVYLFLDYSGQIDNYFELLSGRQRRSISKEPRYFIWVEYIGSCLSKIEYLVFGARLGVTPLIGMYGGNPHSMFIRLHANMGLVCFIVIVAKIIKSEWILWSKNKGFFFLFFALLFRGFNDSAGFTGCYDPLTLFFIFYAYREYLNRKRSL